MFHCCSVHFGMPIDSVVLASRLASSFLKNNGVLSDCRSYLGPLVRLSSSSPRVKPSTDQSNPENQFLLSHISWNLSSVSRQPLRDFQYTYSEATAALEISGGKTQDFKVVEIHLYGLGSSRAICLVCF